MTPAAVVTRILASSALITKVSTVILGLQKHSTFRGYSILSKPVTSSRRSVLIFLIGPPILYLTATITRLLYKYPTTDIIRSHPVYKSRDDSRFKQLYGHWFTARVPLRSLTRSASEGKNGNGTVPKAANIRTPIEIWTSTFFCTPTLSLEAIGIGLATRNGFKTGDRGEEGLFVGQGLVHGVFNIISLEKESTSEHEILKEDKDGVNGKLLGRAIVSYDLPDYLAYLWEIAAKYGAPWRHISGGRHCFEVVEEENGREGEVMVRFGCVIDMEKVNRQDRENGEDGKGMPGFYVWLHEVYARWLVDGAVRKLRKL